MPTEQRRHTVAALVTQIAGPMDTGLLVRGLAALEDAVSALRDQLAATTARADRLDLLVETERGRIVAVEAKAAADLATASTRLDDLTAKLAAAQDKAKAAEGQVLTLAKAVNEAADADAERNARGRWARLRAAWRGE